MVPVSMVLFLVHIAEVLPPGYILLMFALCWGFVRMVVEEDTDPKTDLYPLLLQVGILIAFVVVLVALFGVEPIHLVGKAIRWFDETVGSKFYLAAAGYFLLISIQEVLTAWLARRHESDGEYLEGLSIFGRGARVHVFAGQVSDTERDVFEIVLGAYRFFARSAGDKPIDHAVIFFGHGLDTLFSVGSTTTGQVFDRAEAELRQPTHAHPAGGTSTNH